MTRPRSGLSSAARLPRLLLLALLLAGCSQVQPHLVVPEFSLGDPSFLTTMEAVIGAPVTDGNDVDFLLNGDNIFPAQIAAIRSARKSVNYAQYYYEEGDNAKAIAEALAERCRAGITVKVLLDAFGTLLMPSDYRTAMEQAGCKVVTFRPLTHVVFGRGNNRNHRRILVVDGRLGFTGGSGAAWRWMGDGKTKDHWRDTDARIQGPAVSYLQGAFAENWLEGTGEVLGGEDYFPPPASEGQGRVQVIRSSPAGGGSSATYTMYRLAIARAQRFIHITNPYFVPDERMRDALVDAARRGVKIVVLLPGAIDNNIVRQASRRELGPLLEAGVQVYEYRPALLHAKIMIVDGIWATLGSTNLDNRSFALNDELNVAFYGRDLASRLDQTFADDLTRARPVTYDEWRNRGLTTRLLELLAVPIRDQL